MSMSFRDSFGEVLLELGGIYRNLVVVDTDLSKSTRTSYFARKYPERFIQVGISEQDAIGTASGLAIGGKIPILAVYSMFLMRGWEQIRNTISRDNLNVKIVGTHSGLSDYMDGASHQCFEDIALMRVLPNFVIASPSDIVSTRSLFKQIIGLRGPAYFRLGRDNSSKKIYETEDDVRLGKSNVLCDGNDIAIISYGAIVQNVLDASNVLKKRGITATVVDMHTIKPLDTKILNRLSNKKTPLFVVEDHSIYGGLGSAVTEYLSESNPTRVFRLGIEDKFGIGELSYERLLDVMGFTPQKIADKIEVRYNAL